jgi:hypothetical protein
MSKSTVLAAAAGAVPSPTAPIACPARGAVLLRKAAVIAEGFTRHLGAWERWEAPLQPATRAMLLVEVDEAARAASERLRQKAGNGQPRHYKAEIDPKDFTWESLVRLKRF